MIDLLKSLNPFEFVRVIYYICTYKLLQMDTKLTLKLDSEIIAHAKSYAKMKNISLSKLIESYLTQLVELKGHKHITPLVKSLSGIIDLPADFVNKKEYMKHVLKKYSK